jgi:predicted small secreted protein
MLIFPNIGKAMFLVPLGSEITMQRRALLPFSVAVSATVVLAACSPAPGSGGQDPSEDGSDSTQAAEFDGSQMVIGQGALTVNPPDQSSSGKPTDISRLEITAGEMKDGLCNAQIQVFYASDEAKQRLLTPSDSGEVPLIDDVFQASSTNDPGRKSHGSVADDGSTVTVEFSCATTDEPTTSGEATSSSAVVTDIEAQGQTAMLWAFTVNSTGAIIPTETGQLAGNRMTLADDGAFVQE